MAIGFVLISVAPAHKHEVYNKLSKTPEIIELHPLFGEYDLIAKIEVEDDLGEVVVSKIRSIEGVVRLSTVLRCKRGSREVKKESYQKFDPSTKVNLSN